MCVPFNQNLSAYQILNAESVYVYYTMSNAAATLKKQFRNQFVVGFFDKTNECCVLVYMNVCYYDAIYV